MPIKGFRCDVDKSPVSFDACIGCAATRKNMERGCFHSDAILRGIRKSIREPIVGVTVTELLDCPRAYFLKKRFPIHVYPSRAFWAFRGTMAHQILEGDKQACDIVEKRFFMDLMGVKVSGCPDLIRGDRIIDWKTARKIPARPNESHVLQLSMYRVICSAQNPPIKISAAELTYLDMNEHRRFDVTLLPENATRDIMIKKLEVLLPHLKRGTTPAASEHFNPQNWRCGSTPERSYCEARQICQEDGLDAHVSEKDPKPRRSVRERINAVLRVK